MLLATRAVIWPQRAAQATAQPQQHAHKATKASAARRQSDRPAAAAAPRRGAAATPPLGRAWRLAAIRGVDSYDGSFQLDEQQRETLEELLRSEMFCNEVVQSCKLPAGTQVEWTGVLFPPLPWSPTTKKGMPQEIEERFHGKPFYTFINVPPVFMFKAKIFNPARLCTIYKHKEQPSPS